MRQCNALDDHPDYPWQELCEHYCPPALVPHFIAKLRRNLGGPSLQPEWTSEKSAHKLPGGFPCSDGFLSRCRRGWLCVGSERLNLIVGRRSTDGMKRISSDHRTCAACDLFFSVRSTNPLKPIPEASKAIPCSGGVLKLGGGAGAAGK